MKDGRGGGWLRRVLDCPQLHYGSSLAYRWCRHERRGPQGLPQMTVLEIIEEEPGHIRVVEDEHAGTFAIKLPLHFKLDKPKCTHNEIYVSELDVCVDAAEHLVKPKALTTKRGHVKKDTKREEAKVDKVGKYEKVKCAAGEIWVPEVDLCLNRNPPPPLEPEEDPDTIYDY
ncbi:hypothetical protein GWK47_024100 [Chionoecetes opilio]|uniref:Uncharacterized protein n=1 Tax=Chionoecetes opilio TaxID=41210 RepID=A0A8J5CCM7_CHIOP|nr:hypothetical protein GWK47_024100 [Chionoecetes opilio]